MPLLEEGEGMREREKKLSGQLIEYNLELQGAIDFSLGDLVLL